MLTRPSLSPEHLRRSAAQWAGEQWSDFPWEAQPRPWVLPGGPVLSRGFRTREAKLAYLHGDFAPDDGFPDEPLSRLRDPRAIIAAHDAPPLRLRSALRSTTVFRTDRGHVTLPAWKVTAPEALAPIWVLAEDAGPIWMPPDPPTRPPPPGTSHSAKRAVLAEDQRTLRLTFAGAPSSAVEYLVPEVVTQGGAVSLVIGWRRTGTPANGWVTAVGVDRVVLTRLEEPLGGRVLVDIDASPVEVLVPNS